jgi:hypothetical protein
MRLPKPQPVGSGVEVVFARGINEDFIFPTRPAAASSETPQPNPTLQVTAPEVATARTLPRTKLLSCAMGHIQELWRSPAPTLLA